MALVPWTQSEAGKNNAIAALHAVAKANADPTTSYVASGHVIAAACARLGILIKATWNSATSIEWYYEWSHDATTWYRGTNIAESTGTDTATAEAKTYAIGASINLSDVVDVVAAYFRVNIKRTGGAGTDTVEIIVTGLSPRR